MNKSAQKVFVGLSGGVDSSVAALRLKRAGFDVVGVFIKVWQPDFLECDAEKDRLDAMRAAAHLDIPFLTFDAALEYRRDVGEYFIKEYERGRTPNPDVMCNRYVKFGAFWNFAKEHGADYIATGHYAQIINEDGRPRLYRGVDTAKDQSYFLWTLTEEDLAHTLFPIGDTIKEKVRAEAMAAGLPTATRKDSQGVCFLGHVDIPEFIGHFVDLKEGIVIDKLGKPIGTHQGALVYTLGQRHGFKINTAEGDTKPHFVVDKDIARNTITVDTKPALLVVSDKLLLESSNFIGDSLPRNTNIEAQFRYRQKPFVVTLSGSKEDLRVTPLSDIEKPDSGQSVVFYDKDQLIGGAVIK
ncbi:tRNA 2-thiouridine(34) synthase MnmA [Candidatus Kaiserbacteria bacterium RIFOXYB1_FULL_46_14]|uniref:tRNA-specific 2-thiouridylase MnmA n=1 Tax=Candidatus Kaiserbacteria bacterium RIFOXYB1_FULL_46_14 TaxID=1798531 RepID=A0A1F6FJV1_9BACT|nr:MAG: tRNA 2-thiouridine(34) synthase MnmA [Candidatus Kaiserbacteria bacterium RIFOXYB1_FULL_46_14]